MATRKRKPPILHDWPALVGRRARLWIDRDKDHYVDGTIQKQDNVFVLLLKGGRSYYILNANRDLEVLEGEEP